MSDRPEAPSWWKSLGNRRHGAEAMDEKAMTKLYNRCHRGTAPKDAADHIVDQQVGLEDYPQDRTAVSSVLGDTCPRCGGQLEHHEGLERDYPDCPNCRWGAK